MKKFKIYTLFILIVINIPTISFSQNEEVVIENLDSIKIKE